MLIEFVFYLCLVVGSCENRQHYRPVSTNECLQRRSGGRYCGRLLPRGQSGRTRCTAGDADRDLRQTPERDTEAIVTNRISLLLSCDSDMMYVFSCDDVLA